MPVRPTTPVLVAKPTEPGAMLGDKPGRIDYTEFVKLACVEIARFERAIDQRWQREHYAAMSRGEPKPRADMSPSEWWELFQAWRAGSLPVEPIFDE
jgi:hypothetical protein